MHNVLLTYDKRTTHPLSFLAAAAEINEETVVSARRVGDGMIEIYSREARTGVAGQAVKLWDFVSGRAFERRRLVNEVMQGVIGKCRSRLGYDLSETIQKRLMSNALDRDLSGADFMALKNDMDSSLFSSLPEGPALEELPQEIQKQLLEGTQNIIGKYRKKISKNKLDSGHVQYLRRKITNGISSACKGVKQKLYANICSPIGNLFKRKERTEGTPAAAPVEEKISLNGETENKIIEKLSRAWQTILTNDAMGQKFVQDRARLLNSSGSMVQYGLLYKLVIRDNYEDSATMRRIFKRAFLNVVEQLVPNHETVRQEIVFSGQKYVLTGEKPAGNGCNFYYYKRSSGRTNDPGIMIKSVDDPSAKYDKMLSVNTALGDEIRYYTSDAVLQNGDVAGLPDFQGTVRMQSGAIGLVFSRPISNFSAEDFVSFVDRMEKAKQFDKDETKNMAQADKLRTQVLHDLLTGLSFLQQNSFAGTASFNLANVRFGSDAIARTALSVQPRQFSAPAAAYIGGSVQSGMDDRALRIEEIIVDEPSSSGSLSGESGLAIALNGSFSSGSSTSGHMDGFDSSDDAVNIARSLTGSLFRLRDSSQGPLQDFITRLLPGGDLESVPVETLLQHDLFGVIAHEGDSLRKYLSKMIEKKVEHIAKLDKVEKEAIAKAEKQQKKYALKAIKAAPSSELVRTEKPKKKKNVVKRFASSTVNFIGNMAIGEMRNLIN